MKFSGPVWSTLYRHFFPEPDWSVCSVLEAWEKTRSQRKRNGWLPNPARLAKLESRDLPGLGKKGEKEIRIYLEQHGLTFREDLDALSRKEQHLIKLIENCKKALEETQQRIRNCKGNDGA